MSELRPRANRLVKPAGVARHGRLRKSNPWITALKLVAGALAVVLVSAGSIASITAYQLTSSVTTVDISDPADEGGNAAPPNIDSFPGGFNILIVGSDTGVGQGALGEGRDAALNDVTMILHVSQDHTNAVAVSIPRDMVVPIPACPKEDGSGNYHSMTAQPINVTLSYGGLPCTVLTVEALTGLDIQFAGLITFTGVIEMSNAVGGVPVCLAEAVHDKFTGFTRPAGTSVLQGYDALMFLRSRHGVGDGSDLTRISSQQVFLSSLVRTLKSSDTLNDFPKLYQIASAALGNMTLSSNLANLDTLVSVARALKDIPLESVTFVQYPGTTGQPGVYQGKVAPIKATAAKLFAKIMADEPFALPAAGDGIGSELDPNAVPAPAATVDPSATATATPTIDVIPGLRGQTAADQTCSVGR